MSASIETDQELTGEALNILQKNLSPHKLVRLRSIWHVGQGDYVRERDVLFAGQSVETLFQQASSLTGQ